MSKKAYNSPERKKRRDEGYRVFSDRTREPTKEEQIKDMEAWQKGINENYNKDKVNKISACRRKIMQS